MDFPVDYHLDKLLKRGKLDHTEKGREVKKALIQKALFGLGDLATSGLLTPEQDAAFVRLVIDSADLLPLITTVVMSTPQKEYNKIKLTDQVTFPANYDPSTSNTYYAGRELTEAKKKKPTTSKVTLSTSGYICIWPNADEVMEDNIEGSSFEDTMLATYLQKMGQELDDLLINGDEAVSVTNDRTFFLASKSGILKKTTTNVYDALNKPLSVALIQQIWRALPKRYHRFKNQYRLLVSYDRYADAASALSSKVTSLGDSITLSGMTPTILGMQLTPIQQMPDDQALLMRMDNLLYGVQRGMRIERQREARLNQTDYVVTYRMDHEFLEEEANVKIANLGAITP